MKRLTFIYKPFIVFGIILLTVSSLSAHIAIQHVEPTFWWVDMKNPKLQILVHANNISGTMPEFSYAGIKLDSVTKVENPNYLFLNLTIDKNTLPGSFTIRFKNGKKIDAEVIYELKERNVKPNIHQGFTASDVIYLLMPDRFSNGDTQNDNCEGMLEKADRSNPNGRHGGDLQGVINHLDYFTDLGVTALWLNPFLENNQPSYSYHGYAISDFYNTDARYGTNNQFVELVDKAHQSNLKVIMDMIFNHCGSGHWWINDLPSNDWLNQHDEFTRSNFRAPTVADPYASAYDKSTMLTGWFDVNMPDLNQDNALLSTYLIQNTLWWIEFSGIDGIRVDTQPYPSKEFIAKWAQSVMEAYPGFNIVGEAWLQKILITAYFQGGAQNADGYDSHMPCITDFPMYFALADAFNESEGWTQGMARLYYILAQDFAYPNPDSLLVFCDNHDLNRFYESVNKDMDKFKMGLAYLLTTRGIPQIYYGTEIAMDGQEHQGHGFIRKDFPGGWTGDSINAFLPSGRNDVQAEAFNYLKTLLNWRKSKSVIHTGQVMHFLPIDGVYVLFRYTNDEAVMLILNNNDTEKEISTERYNEILKNYSKGFDVISKNELPALKQIKLDAKSARIIELSR